MLRLDEEFFTRNSYGINFYTMKKYSIPPRTGVFKPIRTDGTFDRWPKKIATQSSTWKNPYRDFDPKKQSLQYRGEIPIRTFLENQSLQYWDKAWKYHSRAHIHVNFKMVKNSMSSHTTTQSTNLGEL